MFFCRNNKTPLFSTQGSPSEEPLANAGGLQLTVSELNPEEHICGYVNVSRESRSRLLAWGKTYFDTRWASLSTDALIMTDLKLPLNKSEIMLMNTLERIVFHGKDKKNVDSSLEFSNTTVHLAMGTSKEEYDAKQQDSQDEWHRVLSHVANKNSVPIEEP